MPPTLRQWLGPLALILLASSCNSAVARPVTTPSGRRGYAIDCRGNQNNCFEKAGEVCPQGYDIVDDARGTTGVRISSGYATGVSIDKKFSGQLLIACSTGETDSASSVAPSSKATRARYAASAPPTAFRDHFDCQLF
jgi:hypothetical protein